MRGPIVYGKITEEQKRDQEKKRLEVERSMQETIKQGKKCLESTEFIKYLGFYRRLREETIDKLIDLSDSGCLLDNFTFEAIASMSKLKVLKNMIEEVEYDALKPEVKSGRK